MRWTGKAGRSGRLAALLLTLLGGGSAAGEAAGPGGQLDSRQLAQLNRLESQAAQALAEGEFPKAVDAVREIASLRERWQGGKHAESAAARGAVKWYEGLLRLPEKERQEVARSWKLTGEANALDAQQKYRDAEEPYRQALVIRRKVLGEEHPHTALVCNALALNLNAQGKYAEAQPLFEKAVAIDRKVLGEEHPETAAVSNNLAITLNAQARYAEAQPLFEKVLAAKRKMLGENHPHTALSCNNLAYNLNAQAKYAAAQPLYEKALAIYRKTLGEEHPDTARSCNNVAGNLYAQARYAEAQPLFEKALAIYRRTLGEEHPDTAAGCNNVAANLEAQGQYAEAQRLHEKALAIKRKVLGEEHADTATSYNNLAFNLNTQGKYAEAQPLFEKALAIKRKVLGEEHPDTATTYTNLGINLNTQAKYAEAQPLFEKALAILRKVVGEGHPLTATGYDNLAYTLNKRGKFAEAQPLFEKALDVHRKVLGEEHPTTANSCNNVAGNLNAQGKFAEAQPLLEKALSIKRKALGEWNPETAVGYSNVAANLNRQGHCAEAQPLAEKSLAICRKVLGEEHPLTASSYDGLAANLQSQGRYAEAQPLFEKSLANRRKLLGEEHPETATSCDNLARNLEGEGRYAEAQLLFDKALAIRRKALGEEHPHTAAGWNNLALNLGAQGRHADAQPLFEKALALFRKLLGEDHPDTALGWNNVALNLYALGRYADAQPLYEKALALRRQALGEEHPDTASTCNNLGINLHLQGKYAEAQPLLEQALAIKRKVLGEEHPEAAGGANNVAANLWRLNKIDEAVRLLQESLPGQEAARFRSARSGFDRAVAASTKLNPQDLLALGLACLHRPAEAFGHAEAGLARGLLEDLAAPTPEVRRIASLHERLDALDRQLLPLFGRVTLSPDRQALREHLVRQRRQTLTQLARLSADVSARQLVPLDEIQKQLPRDSALVLWLDLDSLGEHHACVVRPRGEPAWVRLPGSGKGGEWTAKDRDLPGRLYRLLEKPTSRAADWQGLSDALRRQRLEPLRPHLKVADGLPAVRQLLVVPTGWAGVIPLEVLTADYRISYVPSGSVYARLRRQHRPVEGSSLLALGDPVYTSPAVRRPEPPEQGLLVNFVQPGGAVGRAGLRGGDVLLEMAGLPLASVDDLKKALARGGPLRYWRDGKEQSVALPAGPLGVRLDPRPARQAVAAWRQAEASPVRHGADPVALPGTRWEVEALSRLVPRTTALLGSEASEQRLEDMAGASKLGAFRLVHLAAHGVVDWQTPERSRLLLARDRLAEVPDRSPGRRPHTGELTVGAIRESWKLDADLVTLSACRTALGREGQGEGLLGFTQAFLQCGARSVVLSRWTAEDTATALLMLRFYENLLGTRKDLKKALPRAEALEEAKKWLRELPRPDAEGLASALRGGKLADTRTRGTVVELNLKEPPPRPPEGEKPYAHPYFWATFVLVGDPE